MKTIPAHPRELEKPHTHPAGTFTWGAASYGTRLMSHHINHSLSLWWAMFFINSHTNVQRRPSAVPSEHRRAQTTFRTTQLHSSGWCRGDALFFWMSQVYNVRFWASAKSLFSITHRKSFIICDTSCCRTTDADAKIWYSTCIAHRRVGIRYLQAI